MYEDERVAVNEQGEQGMRFIVILLAALTYFVQPPTAIAAEEKMVTVKSKRGVFQPFLFVHPDTPKAGVILFVGGAGVLKLSSSGRATENENNFFSRTYDMFSNHGLMVALIDIPSDKKKLGPLFRIGKQHAGDMIAVINFMKKKADVPIWMVGTSMGSFSAASVAIKVQKKVSGLVLTSSVTRPGTIIGQAKIPKKFSDSAVGKNIISDGVAGMNLKRFTKPVLIVSHKYDSCEVSPPEDAAKLKSKFSKSTRVEVVMLEGGNADKSDPCTGLASHGFYGIEEEAVKRIAAFITQ